MELNVLEPLKLQEDDNGEIIEIEEDDDEDKDLDEEELDEEEIEDDDANLE